MPPEGAVKNQNIACEESSIPILQRLLDLSHGGGLKVEIQLGTDTFAG